MSHPHPRRNADYAAMFGRLATIASNAGENHRERAYKTAQEAIMNITADITCPADVKNTPGIGKGGMSKLLEYHNTGTLPDLEAAKSSPYETFAGVYGIGPKKIANLVEAGITTIAALREHEDCLNAKQRIGLKYYEDIQLRIPRDEIDRYNALFNRIVASSARSNIGTTYATHRAEIVGSWRRGTPDSGDIDVIISGQTSEIFRYFVDALINAKIIVEVLSRGDCKCLVIARLTPTSTARRLDFLYSPPDELACAMLYFTGSATFNTVMRAQVKSRGYTINEHEVCTIDVAGQKGARVPTQFASERDIFRFFGMQWKEPHERIDGRAVCFGAAMTPADAADLEFEIEPTTPVQHVENYRKWGLKYFATLTPDEAREFAIAAESAYRNTAHPLMSDAEYDPFERWYRQTYNFAALADAVVEQGRGKKVALPCPMPSLAKFTYERDGAAIKRWFATYGQSGATVSAKLDGTSGLYVGLGTQADHTAFKSAYPNIAWRSPAERRKLYTHSIGGLHGCDVSHILESGISLGATTAVAHLQENFIVRGEYHIKREIFYERYADTNSNVRNMVAGLMNSLPAEMAQNADKLADMCFVAYEVIEPAGLTPDEQFAWLTRKGFHVAKSLPAAMVARGDPIAILHDTAIEWRNSSEFDIDGLVVKQNAPCEGRSHDEPKTAFAFKMEFPDQFATTICEDVIYRLSKDGKYIPRVKVEPVLVGGVWIKCPTGHNAQFIKDNGIAPGVTIILKRSGDVIPKIVGTENPSAAPKLPAGGVWDANGVHMLYNGATGASADVHERNVAKFFKDIGVDGLGPGNIRRIMAGGFDSIEAIIGMTVEACVATVQGFETKMATKVVTGIRAALERASLATLMTASNRFGQGFNIKRCELILNSIPTILTSKAPAQDKICAITNIRGLGEKIATDFVTHIGAFCEFMRTAGLWHKVEQGWRVAAVEMPVEAAHPLRGREIVVTGGVKPEVAARVRDIGVTIGQTVKASTAFVVAKTHDDTTGKANDARRLGVRIVTSDEFVALTRV